MSILYNYIRKSHILAIIEEAISKKSTSINLTYFEIENLPKELFECREIERLYLHYNKINVFDAAIVQLCNITTLTIDYNALSVLPVEIGNLVNLQNLNVSHNPLKKLLPEIGQLTKLEVLWCNSIDMENLPEELGKLPELDTFGARGNKLRQLPKSFTNLKKLRWLTLENNLMNKLPEEMDKLESLVHLNLKRNELRKLPKNLFKCKHMQYLFIANNQISSISLCGEEKLDLRFMKHLVYIDIRDNPFIKTSAFKENLKYYPKLKTCDDWQPPLIPPVTEVVPGTSAGADERVTQNGSDSHQTEDGLERDNRPLEESDASSVSSSDDWENSYPSSQLDSTDHSDEDFEENEVVGNYLPELSRFVGTGS